MARQQEFDSNTVLQVAVELFWKKGYYDTSIEELVQQTGVSRYSLYGVFESKHGLFLAALDYYQQTLVTELLKEMEAPEAGLETIHAYFNRLLALAETRYGRLGCFMCNTATELALHDAVVAQKVQQQYDRWHRAFCNGLRNAQDKGELAADLDIASFADYLVGVLQGVLVLARSQQPLPMIRNHIRIALAPLNYSASQIA